MAKSLVVAKIVFDKLPELRGELRQQASVAIRKVASNVKARATPAVPIDTGFLVNSIYVSTHTESEYQEAKGEAESAEPTRTMLPEVERPGELQAVVAVGAEYGAYVEYGTHKMAARPYLGPAAEAVRPGFEAAMKRLLG